MAHLDEIQAAMDAVEPIHLDLTFRDGDSWRELTVRVPNLEPIFGPADLSAATLTAQVRPWAGSETVQALGIERFADGQTVRFFASAERTHLLPDSGVWEFRVSQTMTSETGLPYRFSRAIFAGKTRKSRGIAR